MEARVRRTRRWRTGAGAAIALAGVCLGVVVVVTAGDGSPGPEGITVGSGDPSGEPSNVETSTTVAATDPSTLVPPPTDTNAGASGDDAAGSGVFSEPTGAVLLFDDGLNGVLAIELDAGMAARRTIEGQKGGDPPYRMSRVGDWLAVGFNDVHLAPIAGGRSRSLGPSLVHVPAVEPHTCGWSKTRVEPPASGQPRCGWSV